MGGGGRGLNWWVHGWGRKIRGDYQSKQAHTDIRRARTWFFPMAEAFHPKYAPEGSTWYSCGYGGGMFVFVWVTT